jgi:hypothetical protein
MPRDGAIIFRDLVRKRGGLRIECPKCQPGGRYRLDRLIEKYGIGAQTIRLVRRNHDRLFAQAGPQSIRPMRRDMRGAAEDLVTASELER